MSDDVEKPPIAVTPGIFAEWRSPRRGNANPEQLNNPLWEWLIETRLSAYSANEVLKGPSSVDAGPMWCFDRFGQTTTQLPDGRTVLIGGEHEDFYDSDFHIYNDLVITSEEGGTQIFGYSRTTFPPTDFHSASAVDNRIILLGNLGYAEDRRAGQTQVLVVECRGWSVSRIDSHGHLPGWIHGHQAAVQADGSSILVSGGQLFRGEEFSLVENIDDWLLHLDDWRWERMTERRWERFEFLRKDRRPNHLWALRIALWEKKANFTTGASQVLQLEADLGSPPRLDVLPLLYRPPIPHEVLPEVEGEYNVHRIRIEGTIVRFVEDHRAIQATIEGKLPGEAIEQMLRHVTTALETLEQCRIVCEGIRA